MGILSFVGDLASDIFGGNSSRKDSNKYALQQMDLQQEYNRENMARQQQYNLQNMGIQQTLAQRNMAAQFDYERQAFDYENAYNTPFAQRQRMMEAGLNPNFAGNESAIASMDGAVSPTMPSSSGVSSGSVSAPGTQGMQMDFLGSLMQLIGFKNQQDNVRADTNKKNAEANETNEMLPYNKKQADANVQQMLTQAFKNDTEARYYSKYIDKQIEHLDFANLELWERAERIRQLLPHEIDKMDADQKQAINMAAYYKVLSIEEPKRTAAQQKQASAAAVSAGAAASQAATAARKQQEDARHNRVDEALRKQGIDVERMIAVASSNKMDAETVNQKILNGVEGQLYQDNVQTDERTAKLNEVRKTLRLLDQQYKRDKPKVAYSEWILRELRKRDDMTAIEIFKALHSDVLY